MMSRENVELSDIEKFILPRIKKEIEGKEISDINKIFEQAGFFDSEYISAIGTAEKAQIIKRVSEESQEGGILLSINWTFPRKKPIIANISPGSKIFFFFSAEREKSEEVGEIFYLSDDFSVQKVNDEKAKKEMKISKLKTLGLSELVEIKNISDYKMEKVCDIKSQSGAEILSCLYIFLSSVILGGVQKAFELSSKYSSERIQGGKPIGKYFAIKEKLRDMETFILLLSNSINSVCSKIDAIRETSQIRIRKNSAKTKEISSTKIEGRTGIENIKDERLKSWYLTLKDVILILLFAIRESGKLISEAIQIHGGYGYMKDYKVEKIFRNIETLNHILGTKKLHRLLNEIEEYLLS